MPEGISYQDSSFKKVISLSHPEVRQSFTLIASVGGESIEAGAIFGKVTADGTVRPLGVSYITKAEALAADEFEVADASIFKVGDSVKIGGGSAVTLTAVDVANKKISIATEDAQTATLNAAVEIQDGSATAFGVLLSPVTVAAATQPVVLLIHGMVYAEAITNVLRTTQLATAKSELFNRIWFVESY